MSDIDPVIIQQRLAENYSQMTEDELAALAEKAYDLVPVAKQALEAEIRNRGLRILLQSEPAAEPELPEIAEDERPDDYNPADWDLVNLDRLWDADRAKHVKAILDAATIPSYFGPDNVTDLSDLTSSYNSGVYVRVRAVDRGRAYQALVHAPDENELPEPEEELSEDADFAVLCPKCRSAEVVFQGQDDESAPADADAKYIWHCDDCGHEWKDDGMVQELRGARGKSS
jgi:DNA-directed RNA polymerase subunit M/transcription elongation factor TFIIS